MTIEVAGYEDLERLADGGFSTVYRAYEREFDRTVAIKVLHAPLNEITLPRFDRERRTLGSLSTQPNILTVFGSGMMPDGRGYLILEYCPGGSFGERVARDGPLAWQDVMPIVVKLAGALAVAHERGVIHRDLKPDNLLVTLHGEPVIADFGIAWASDDFKTTTGLITASLAHAPPEVLDGQRATPASDIYSLASTAYHLIIGNAPFRRTTDESPASMLARILSEPPPDLRMRGVPESICKVLERAMSKDVVDRFSDANEFAAALVGANDVDECAVVVAEQLLPDPTSQNFTPDIAEQTIRRAFANEVPRKTPIVGGLAPSNLNAVEAKAKHWSATGAQASGRLRIWRAVGGVAAAVITVVVAVRLVALVSDKPTVAPELADATVDAALDVGDEPSRILHDGKNIWVTNFGSNTLSRINSEKFTVTATIQVGRGPQAIAAGDGSLWVSNTTGNTVSRIDPARKTVTATIKVGRSPDGIAYDGHNIWVVNTRDDSVSEIDVSKNTVVASIKVGDNPIGIARVGDDMWVTSFAEGVISKIDTATETVVATVKVGVGPIGILSAGERVWVTNFEDNTVSIIDAAAEAVVATIEVGGLPSGLAYDGTDIWVTNFKDNTVTRIDATKMTLRYTVKAGESPIAIAANTTAVWIANFSDGTVTRVKP